MSKRDRMDLAMEQEFERVKDESLGRVPRERLYEAYLEAERRRSTSKYSKRMISPNWTERGPDNVGGRTRGIMIDPNDGSGNTVFAAGVSGGLWKTTNISSISPTWNAVNDFFENLAISSIAYDPTETDTMYFGTGEGWFNIDATQGDGIFKSNDGGDTWRQLSSTTSSTFDFVQKIVVHPDSGDVYAATRTGGVMRSTDGGANWSSVLSSGSGAGTSRAADLEIAANSSIYAAMGIFGTDGVYSSPSGNSGTWTKLNTGANGFPTSGFERIELAVAPANANIVYAFVQSNAGDSLEAIYRTTNKGSTWSAVTNPSDDDPGVGTDFTRGQAWYNLIAAVSPTDASGDTLFAGGIDLFKSTNGGTSWTQITHWYGGFGFQEVHADQHAIVFADNNPDIILFGNDGGVYRTTDGTATTPTISSKNTGYNTTQFYACAMHPDAGSNHFLAGAQDNGTNKFNSLGINTTTEVVGGDGAFCHIDQGSSTVQIAQTTNNNIYRSLNGGSSFSQVLANSGGNFINASDYDNTSFVYYSAFNSNSYVLWSNPRTGTSFSAQSVTDFGGTQASAITVSPNTANRVFFGTEGGRVVRVDDAASTLSSSHINSGAGMPTSDVSCIEVEDGDDNHILVTYFAFGATSIWETTNGGTSWTSVEGDLPDIPVRWAMFNPSDSDQALIATDLGVWSTDDLDGGSTSWSPSNTGLANVRVDMLQYRSSDGLVIAATHGRGMYSTDIFATSVSADFIAVKPLDYFGNTTTFTDGSLGATSWSWNFGDGNTSTAQNPTHTYAAAGKYSVTLSINGGAESEVKSDYIHILPNRGTPYLAADGGNFETNPDDFGSEAITGGLDLWERGTPSNDITTLNSASNGWKTDLDADITEAAYSCALYSPSFNLTVAGTYSLSFRKSMAVRYANAPFGVYVEYSTNQGDSWTQLGTDADANGTNWYERGPSSSFTHSITPGGYAFCNDFTNQNTAYDISSLSGNDDVCFRIVFICATGYSADGYTEDGFMVDDFQITGESNDPVLPVELQSFSANPLLANNTVELNWETESEVDNSHWLIDRATNNGEWQTIAQLEGQGTTPTATEYSYIDEQVQRGITYSYRLADVSYAGVLTYHGPLTVTLEDGDDQTPATFALDQNYPNPFNPSTTIRYSLKNDVRTRLTVYNVLGEKITTLVDGNQIAGAKSITWFGDDDNGNRVASGVYIYRIEAGSFVKSRKMILLY
ncbi:MAG: PKD domain-containing protein [Calditrichia bacterium]